jgi:hypothetical protein
VAESLQHAVNFRLRGWKAWAAEATPKSVREGMNKAKKDWLSAKPVPEGSLPADVIGKVQAWDKVLPVAWDAAYIAAYRNTTDAHNPLLGERPPFYKDVAFFKEYKLADLGKAADKIRQRVKARRAQLTATVNLAKQLREELKVARKLAEDRRKEARAAARKKMPWDDWMKSILDQLRNTPKVKNRGSLTSKINDAVKRRNEVLEEWETLEFIEYDTRSLEARLASGKITDKDRKELNEALAEAKKKEAGFRQKIREAEDDIVKTLEEAQDALEKASK